MQFIADLHIHSHFSRATSKLLVPEYLDYWAGIKGVDIVGTGDFTHPGWLSELREKLEPEGNGLFRLKKEFRLKPLIVADETRFLLTAEISNIYKRGDKVRKVHNIVMVPGFEEADKINQRLINLGGNLKSDGRPILGLDSRDLLEIVLECGSQNFFIPAHIWTPWFSMLGSRSGFDSPGECFGDLLPYIHAVETGLSTDAPMNWLCSFLDNCVLVSNSDAHSPERLGRNANVFQSEKSYQGITEALKHGNDGRFLGTIDLYPQEGKYHYDGHRKCNICWDPAETARNKSVCLVCGKPVTAGVMNRIVQLSDREDVSGRKNKLPFRSIIPLAEILAEIAGVGESSKQVQDVYKKTVAKLGNELGILLNIPLETIESKTSRIVAEAIRRMRNREIIVSEGYDGEYGQIKVFHPGEIKNFSAGSGLFAIEKPVKKANPRALIEFDLKGIQRLVGEVLEMGNVAEKQTSYQGKSPEGLNPEQQAAVEFTGGVSIILAGPGTGKTKTLTEKIFYLIKNGVAAPGQILAITFTNKAALEMKNRLGILMNKNSRLPFVSTFHGFGKFILEENPGLAGREENFVLVDENEKNSILKSIPGIKGNKVTKTGNLISLKKQSVDLGNKTDISEIYLQYEKVLAGFNAFDFDDLVVKPAELLQNNPGILQKYREKFRYIFVDEFQDTNPPQFQMIKLLAGGQNQQLCVVGDPNQSIYSFRGSELSKAGVFLEEFPTAEVFRLKTSYRCSQNILAASANVLEQGGGFLEGLNEGVKLNIARQATEKSEAEFIARGIVNLAGGLSFFSIDSGVTPGQKNETIRSLSDFAVLCRTKYQFRSIEKAFLDHNIPFQVVGDKPFYRNPPLSDLLDFYFAAVNYKNGRYTDWLIKDKSLIFKEKLEVLNRVVFTLSVKEGLIKVRDEFFKEGGFDEMDFRRLLGMSESFASAAEFVTSIKTGSASDTYNGNLEAVTLMTLHSSKGLEFECVFIAGCEQGLLPYTLYKTGVNFEEESRLMYVGMTRAKKFLYLSYARSRNFRNRVLNLPKSSFLDKIETELVEEIKSEYRKKTEEGKQLNLF